MNVVVAGRVCASPGVDDEDELVVVCVLCVPDVFLADVCVPDDWVPDVVVDWAPALVAIASATVAAITTRFNIRTSASVTDRPARTSGLRRATVDRASPNPLLS